MNVTPENAAHAIESWGNIRLDVRRGHHFGVSLFCLHEEFARRVAAFFPKRMGRGARSVLHYPAGYVCSTGKVNPMEVWAFGLATQDSASLLEHAYRHLCVHHQALARPLIELGRMAGRNWIMAKRVRRRATKMRYRDVARAVERSGSEALFREAKKLLVTARALCPVPRNAWPTVVVPDPELVLR